MHEPFWPNCTVIFVHGLLVIVPGPGKEASSLGMEVGRLGRETGVPVRQGKRRKHRRRREPGSWRPRGQEDEDLGGGLVH